MCKEHVRVFQANAFKRRIDPSFRSLLVERVLGEGCEGTGTGREWNLRSYVEVRKEGKVK